MQATEDEFRENHNRVMDGLYDLTVALKSFVSERMNAVHGPRWRKEAVRLLNNLGGHRVQAQEIDLDPMKMLQVIREDSATFEMVLQPRGQKLVDKLLKRRNLFAHQFVEIETVEAFEACELLCELFKIIGHSAPKVEEHRAVFHSRLGKKIASVAEPEPAVLTSDRNGKHEPNEPVVLVESERPEDSQTIASGGEILFKDASVEDPSAVLEEESSPTQEQVNPISIDPVPAELEETADSADAHIASTSVPTNAGQELANDAAPGTDSASPALSVVLSRRTVNYLIAAGCLVAFVVLSTFLSWAWRPIGSPPRSSSGSTQTTSPAAVAPKPAENVRQQPQDQPTTEIRGTSPERQTSARTDTPRQREETDPVVEVSRAELIASSPSKEPEREPERPANSGFGTGNAKTRGSTGWGRDGGESQLGLGKVRALNDWGRRGSLFGVGRVARAELTVRSFPSSTVIVDGKPVGTASASWSTIQVSPGSHRVVFRQPGFADDEHDVSLEADEEQQLVAMLDPTTSRSSEATRSTPKGEERSAERRPAEDGDIAFSVRECVSRLTKPELAPVASDAMLATMPRVINCVVYITNKTSQPLSMNAYATSDEAASLVIDDLGRRYSATTVTLGGRQTSSRIEESLEPSIPLSLAVTFSDVAPPVKSVTLIVAYSRPQTDATTPCGVGPCKAIFRHVAVRPGSSVVP
jgi:hypothetical protein